MRHLSVTAMEYLAQQALDDRVLSIRDLKLVRRCYISLAYKFKKNKNHIQYLLIASNVGSYVATEPSELASLRAKKPFCFLKVTWKGK